MNHHELRELAANPNFISGIYNYCDRWCERCAFSSRCYLYATEELPVASNDPQISDLNNAAFWRNLESVFQDAHDLIKECAKEAGVDLDPDQPDEFLAEHEAETEQANKHELSLLARNYACMVETWFGDHLPDLNRPEDGDTETTEKEVDFVAAVEVIRWYQSFIAAKVFRALLGSEDESQDVCEDADDAAVDFTQTDSNGSAKIALIAIDRSFNAWRIVQTWQFDQNDSIAKLMATLDQLRNGIEVTLPLARDFVRPGFDEITSQFAS